MSGSSPGLPGGRITGVLPASGVGARISGSIPGGGQSTPSDLASLSPSGCVAWPVVVPGSPLERGKAADFASGAQVSASATAVGGGGDVAVGGACAAALCTVAANAKVRRSGCILMQRERTSQALVPVVTSTILRFPITDEREVSHRGHRTALGEDDAAMSGCPVHESCPRKFRPPAKPAGERRK
jgi:hypothetical protein